MRSNHPYGCAAFSNDASAFGFVTPLFSPPPLRYALLPLIYPTIAVVVVRRPNLSSSVLSCPALTVKLISRAEAGSSKGRLEGGGATLPGEHLPEQHFKKKYFNQVGEPRPPPPLHIHPAYVKLLWA
jgi:hypothetical protein